MGLFDASSPRIRRTKLGKYIGSSGYWTLCLAALICLISAALLFFVHQRYAYTLLGAALLLIQPAIWWRLQLSRSLPTNGGSLTDRLDGNILALIDPTIDYSPYSFWQALHTNWQFIFICNHLLIPVDMVTEQLSREPSDLPHIWPVVERLATNNLQIEAGHLAAALMLTSPQTLSTLTQMKLTQADLLDVCQWLERNIAVMRRPRQSFGGIGRDWANGFTPRLDEFGHNLSLAIEARGAHFGSLVDSPGVMAMKAAFSQGTSAVALIGPDGIGKTSHAYALAQNLLAETVDRRLEHRQIIGLDASTIIAAAAGPGELEHILSVLIGEAAGAGNIMLFLDDAQLFFQSGTGSFDATQLLLPVVQSRAVQLIFAMSSHDYQQLKATNQTFAGLLSPVVLQEPNQADTLEIIADTAANYEIRHDLLISYQAVKEAYHLSGRYELDMAYPGKAIRLLEQSLTHAENGIVSTTSVQAAVEQATGAKAGTAAPVEAAQLLQLEDSIHERMINQTRAVTVVSAALRRARAGVSNPNRPIGSFLFLGPTGVGKTELAKAIAATYFGSESSLIRLDMSEYQQESDVSRILSGGENETSSLILRVRQQPFSVVLLDEIEKAHPNILNLLLQLLDEGQLTDSRGRLVSFKDAVVIATSNAGADTIRERIQRGEELESFEKEFTDQLISSGQFKPELLNRFDEIVLFRPLKPEELGQVVRLMLGGINQTLAAQNVSVELTDAAVAKIVEVGNDPRLGARPMRRTLQRAVENTIADKLLRQDIQPGDHVVLDAVDLSL